MVENNADSGKFEQYLKAHPFTGNPANLYEAMNYIMQLGGKRLRPQLLLLGYQAIAGTLTGDAMQLALSVETFHNFSLVHDDIMDNAPLRRGKPSVHERWDAGTAILAGDNLLIRCYDLILHTGFANREELLRTFTHMAVKVCEGQQMDMNLPSQDNMDESAYLEMIEMKTAVLPASALKMGALAAGASQAAAEDLYAFGLNLGMAFQLQDDYLDCFGDTDETGKQEGGDIIENKKTLLYLHAMRSLAKDSARELSSWYTDKVHDTGMKVQRVRALFGQAGSDAYILGLKSQYEKNAMAYLDSSCPEGEAKEGLLQLFEFLKTRKA